MPKERRKRAEGHDQSVRLNTRKFAAEENAVEQVGIGGSEEASGTDIMAHMEAPSERIVLKKKEKQQMKHDAFLQRLESVHTPYSKSHLRRLKRKEKEEIGTGLGDMAVALALVDNSVPVEELADQEVDDHMSERPKGKPKPGQIGEGKGAPLSKNQRKRALQTEKLRQPLILSTPEFAANPFQTIRTHAQNTLVKH